MINSTIKIGKKIGRKCYFHVSSIDYLPASLKETIENTRALIGLNAECFNVIRLDQDTIAFLNYPSFFVKACPELKASWLYNLNNKKISFRDFANVSNPPILHRKELLISTEHEYYPIFSALTKDFENIGLFKNTKIIGRENEWAAALRAAGYKCEGNHVLPISNCIDIEDIDVHKLNSEIIIMRHLTALKRQTMSAPVTYLLKNGLLDNKHTFFDYGCGQGKDIEELKKIGIEASGWDPYFANDASIVEADIVNLGFVLNVIENLEERNLVLLKAFNLSQKLLCVSVMIGHQSLNGMTYLDGQITKRSTFQKYYNHEEIKNYIHHVLGIEPIASAPGIFIIFKCNTLKDNYLLCKKKLIGKRLSASRIEKGKSHSDRTKHDGIFFQNRDVFDRLISLWENLGRVPDISEVSFISDVENASISFSQAIIIARRHVNHSKVELSRVQKANQILVDLAVERFSSKTDCISLSPQNKLNFRLVGGLQKARACAQSLLFSASNLENIRDATMAASKDDIGLYEEGSFLLFHISCIECLPLILQIYIKCAQVISKSFSYIDLVEIRLDKKSIITYCLDDFSKPLPVLLRIYEINLHKATEFTRSLSNNSAKEKHLIFKSKLMIKSMDNYETQLKFDLTLARIINQNNNDIWIESCKLEKILQDKNLILEGWMLLDDGKIPSLDDKCGRYLAYRDLIICGETVIQRDVSNLPSNIESYRSLRLLAEHVVDPIIEWFGSIELTYGFCSHNLSLKIRNNIAPRLDQHCCYEKNSKGNYICERLGAAVDFIVVDEDMSEVMKWIISNVEFDRIYYYGSDKPIHVSYGPLNSREVIELTRTEKGKRIPRKLTKELVSKLNNNS